MYTFDFNSEECRNVRLTGGKAASLADMTAAGLPVAPGCAVGVSAYRAFLDQGDLRAQLTTVLSKLDGTYDQAKFDEVDHEISTLFGG